MRHPSVDSTSSSMRRMETQLKSYSSSARNSDSAGARYSSIFAASDTHATARSRAAHGITDLCNTSTNHVAVSPGGKTEEIAIDLRMVIRLFGYVEASVEAEAVEVEDGQVRRAVGEAEASPGLQWRPQVKTRERDASRKEWR
jgi:hypothetical protein